MKLYVNLVILAIISFHSFSQIEVNSQKSVYYPLDSLLHTKIVYCYKVFQNFYYLANSYQAYWARIENNDTCVYQESYSHDFLPDQLWKVKISYLGVELLEHRQKIVETKSDIMHADIIPWESGNHLKYVWIIKNAGKKLKRIRTSAAISDSLDFQKIKHLTYVFTDKIIVREYSAIGKPEKRKLIRTSYHLEGIGLYKSIQKYPGVFITFELDEILDYNEWVKLKEKL